MEAAPRVCTRRRSIVMATFYRLARCWLYSRKAQVGNNQRARETPCDRGGDSAAAMQPRDLPHHSSGVQQLHPARDWLEPISKSPEEDNEAGELYEAEEVLGVVFPTDEDAALPLN